MVDSNGLLRLKKPYSDGTSHLVFSPLDFLEKLAALVPPPRAHLTRFLGVLVPNAKVRSRIVPKLEAKEDKKPKKSKRISWAKLLKLLGRPYKPPDIAPAQYPEQASLEFQIPRSRVRHSLVRKAGN
jgi:hypothetical protein